MSWFSCAAALSLITSLVQAQQDPAAIPRPEHPNPQFQRDEWQNLNGKWDFWEGDAADEKAMAARSEFPDRIVVPFCRESKLSGLGRTGFVKNVLYRRSFTVPEAWHVEKDGARVLIHVGACDWRTTVWVNGTKVGFHEGGSTPVDCDVTSALHAGANELRVWAFDDTTSGVQQLGKQCPKEKSYGCLYTRTTGIWQTVWMEKVGATYLERCAIETDFAGEGGFQWTGPGGPHAAWTRKRWVRVRVVPTIRGPIAGLVLAAEARCKNALVVDGFMPCPTRGDTFEIEFGDPKFWAPVTPDLYELNLTLRRADPRSKGGGDLAARDVTRDFPIVVDAVRSYFAVRKIEVDGDRVLLNHEPVFQRLILDQGFYPDGIWTAPSDAALKHDIELSMAAGFNGARLHQKVFEPRFLYWADRLGYLVWGEAPSWGAKYENPACDRVVLDEWRAEVERDRNHPSIVGWCPFNETDATPGKLQNAATALTRALDPTRPVLDTSGYVHSDPRRDVDDAHDYDQDPKSFRARWWPRDESVRFERYGIVPRDRPFFVSEFGGIEWKKPGDPGWGYGNAPKSEADWFARFEGLCAAQLENPSLFGFCYTQLTDVEQERNGLYYYDRTPKFDAAKLHAIVAKPAAIEQGAVVEARPTEGGWRVVIAAQPDDPQLPWTYVACEKPLDDAAWRAWTLDAATTKTGRPGFGAKGGFEERIGTPWTTPELYLHRTFRYEGGDVGRVLLVMHHDNGVTLCLNGETLFERGGWNDAYEPFDVTERALALLKPGANTITVHVHQDSGGQFFDAALLVAPASH
jgi:hypothetical protein